MKAGEATVTQLFESKHVYEVPRYQRQYVWERDTQWLPLWRDVEQVTDRLIALQPGNSNANRSLQQIVPHFMGAVVVKQKSIDNSTANNLPTWIIVDGQQRLTTILLMMTAIANAFKWFGQDTHAASLKELVDNRHFAGVPQIDIMKLRPAGLGYASFSTLIELDEVTGQANPTGDRLGACYGFYEEKAMAWCEERESTIGVVAPQLKRAVVDMLQVARIELSIDDNEHEIFEALNARGIELTEYDKVKNFLLFEALRQTGDQDDFYGEYLERFDGGQTDDDRWWSERHRVPNFNGNRVNAMSWYWITAQKREVINQAAVYQTVRNRVQGSDNVLEIAGSLRDYADAFEKLEKQPYDHTALGKYRHRRTQLKLFGFTSVYMALRVRLDDEDAFERCMSVMDSYLMRRMIFRNSATGFRSLIPGLLGQIFDATDEYAVIEGLIDSLQDQAGISTKWPDDRDITDRLLGSWSPKSGVQRLILEEVENLIVPDGAGYKKVPRNLTLEHVMPQNWENNWALGVDATEHDLRQRRDHVPAIGNLTLLSQPWNSSLRDEKYAVKVEKLKKDNLELNRRIVSEYPELWDESVIDQRGRWIAEQVCKIWPHGDALKV